nr:RodZ domain-containing protein [uncultured Celeribacter sp.]
MIRRWTQPPVEEQEQPRGFDDYELKLGDVMRGERATFGKSLLDVQRELKIKATYIAAIENSDPSVFETQGFIAGYVRSYARYLHLDPDWAFSRFCQESGFSVAHGMSPQASTKRAATASPAAKLDKRDPFADPNATFVPRKQGMWSGIEPGALGSTAVLLALLGAIGYGGWSVLQEIQKVKMAPVEQAPGLVSEVTPLGADVGAENSRMASLDEGMDLVPPSAEALDRLYRPQALEVPVLVPRDGPIATLDPRSVGALADESRAEDRLAALSSDLEMAALDPASATDSIRVMEEGAPELAIVAVRPSWVRVQAADGAVLFEKILNAGERYVVPAMEEAPILRTGNAGGVYFAVNGQAFGPVGATGSVVKNIALSDAAIEESFETVDLAANDTVAEMFQVAENAE